MIRSLMALLSMAIAASAAPWPRHTIDASSRGADGARLADVNGDGKNDIAVGWEEGGVVRAYLHPGSRKAKESWPFVSVGQAKSPEDAVFADLDGDGAVDVVSSCEGKTQCVFVHWAPKSKSKYLDPNAWITEAIPVTEHMTRWMFCVPLQIDGKNGIDLVVGSKNPAAVVGWLQAPPDPRDLSEWQFHKLCDAGWIMSLIDHDLDGDGDVDILASDRKGANASVFWVENPGSTKATGTWKKHVIGGRGMEVMFLDLVDFDGDGQLDVLAAIKPDRILFLKQGNDPLDAWKTFTIDMPGRVNGLPVGTAKSVRGVDVNGDGRMDLMVTCENAKGEATGAFWMSFRNAVTDRAWDAHEIGGPRGLKYDLIQAVDVDGDGDRDLLTCEERDFNAVLWYENPF